MKNKKQQIWLIQILEYLIRENSQLDKHIICFNKKWILSDFALHAMLKYHAFQSL